jgi:hypothetical protein
MKYLNIINAYFILGNNFLYTFAIGLHIIPNCLSKAYTKN